MNNIEEQILESGEPLSPELAKDIFTRIQHGKIAVVAERPNNLIAPVRKQWLKEVKHLQKLRASTINAQTIERYTKLIALMQRTNFTTKSPYADFYADVYFITPEKLPEFGQFAITLYVTCSVKQSILEDIDRFLPEDGRVVVYRR